MPKVNLNKKPRDYPLELINGRLQTEGDRFTVPEMAEKMGVSDRTMYRLLKKSSDNWTMGQLKKACRYLEIPIDELRGAIRA